MHPLRPLDLITAGQKEKMDAAIRCCANVLDQLFRQRHTMADVEYELRALLQHPDINFVVMPIEGIPTDAEVTRVLINGVAYKLVPEKS